MTEQQYTCPFCLEDYTRFTIHEHYDCGVEPLEDNEILANGNESIVEKIAEAPKKHVRKPKAMVEATVKDTPKKRGRKPKSTRNNDVDMDMSCVNLGAAIILNERL